MKNYIENNFARFVHILRHLGIKISIGETLSAVIALSLVDIMNRDHVKTVLSATLVKNHDQQVIFAQAFDSFFVAPEVKKQQNQAWEKRKEEGQCLLEEAETDLAYKGETLDLTEEEMLYYAQLPEEEKRKIRDYLKASSAPDDRYDRFKPTLESQVRGSLRYWKQRLGEESTEY
ncbi:MAG: hypothetical protein PHX16_08665, partial [Syntrophaceticus sp.]|nr:hypothetical protein [Syntrophaceticus sp.]MDD4783681.1 hypothetical protein [Syntrophaceticus sp.]